MTREEFLKIERDLGEDKVNTTIFHSLLKTKYISGDEQNLVYSLEEDCIIINADVNLWEYTIYKICFESESTISTQVFNDILREYRKFKIDSLEI